MMFGLLATLYLNVYFSLTSCAVLFYVTLKMEPILENNFWESDDYSDSESSTKFGIFPAVGAEYFITPVFAIFAALGYNPYGGAEFGLRLSVGK